MEEVLSDRPDSGVWNGNLVAHIIALWLRRSWKALRNVAPPGVRRVGARPRETSTPWCRSDVRGLPPRTVALLVRGVKDPNAPTARRSLAQARRAVATSTGRA